MAIGMWSSWSDPSLGKGLKSTEACITSLVAVLAVSWFLWTIKRSKKKNAPLPPGPRGLPLIGYLPFLGTEPYKTFTDLAGVYGPIYKLWLGNKLCVVVNSPSLAKEVVRNKDTIYANRDPPIAAQVATYDANDIGWCPYGPHWRKMRKIFVEKIMSNASLDASYPLRKPQVKNTIRDVYNKIGEPTDISALSVSTLINVVQNMMWGCTLEGEKGNTLGAELRDLFAELMALIGAPNISDIFPVLSRFDIQGIERRTKKIVLWYDKIIDSAIENHNTLVAVGARNDGEKEDLLQYLLKLMKNENSATSISMTQLKGLLSDTILGGTDTTTTMVEWAMAELMQHPDAMKEVQEELVEVVGLDSSVEEFHVPKLRYLDAVVKETLRLHTALPLLVPRRSSQSSTIGGYTIPEGTRVLLNVWAIHRDPQLWDNPLEFRPERFVDGHGKFDYYGNDFRYMPFGSGRRICAGLPLAERMLKFVLASLLHSFEWKLPYGSELDLSEQFGLVMKKMTPLVAIPTPRLSNPELYH